jgi:hypothetical protein
MLAGKFRPHCGYHFFGGQAMFDEPFVPSAQLTSNR